MWRLQQEGEGHPAAPAPDPATLGDAAFEAAAAAK
jgi:hypothetical protein